MARGDAFLGGGDIASARLFFQRAADAGDSRAAMRMAVTFDAAFLDRAGVHGVRGDPAQAAFWFRRARELGEAKTGRTAPSVEPPPQPR
jgi:TPR repeat protein